MVDKQKKCCGTCLNWGREIDPPCCLWPEPKLPFWASITNGDHGEYTESDDGKNCIVWEPLCAA